MTLADRCTWSIPFPDKSFHRSLFPRWAIKSRLLELKKKKKRERSYDIF